MSSSLHHLLFVSPVLLAAAVAAAAEPPQPCGVTPSPRQLAWHEMEFYGFLHFTVNTFTDKEWGYGDESPEVFNPTDFDADAIAAVASDAGMAGLILTCKHHDGFCLWPSQYSSHTVAQSPWRGGKGDVVGDIAAACRAHGLKFGVYLSPWDRNHPDYGRPAYVEYYRNQLRELLTNYGPIFEVWFDGANGGDGYYGGAREERKIDRATYYGWEDTWNIVRELQPMAVMFSDVGPDIRWVGNENGRAGDPCWARYTPHPSEDASAPCPGQTLYKEGENGHRDGRYWLPAEVDVSIRPGWFYHPAEDGKVRNLKNLKQLYFQSVGRGASLLLNVPPDRRGRIHENDAAALREFRQWRDAAFGHDLAAGAKASASNIRGGEARFSPARANDGDRATYWCTDDGTLAAEIELDLGKKTTFNVVGLREFLPPGQRVGDWALDRWDGKRWIEFAKGAAIGNRRLVTTEDITARRVRLRIVNAEACPAISEFALYRAP